MTVGSAHAALIAVAAICGGIVWCAGELVVWALTRRID